MSTLRRFLVHTVSVQTKTGSSGTGDVFATAVTVTGVFVSGDGVSVGRGAPMRTSTPSATIYGVQMGDAELFTPGSRVTLPTGRVAIVESVMQRTATAAFPEHWLAAVS